MTKKKLYVFDVDGTLITTRCVFRKRTIKNINRLLLNGDVVAIASGRNFEGAKQFLDKLADGEKYIIAANGGALYDMERNVLDVCKIPYKDFKKFHDQYAWAIKKMNASIMCYTLDAVGSFELTPNIRSECKCNANCTYRNFTKDPMNDDEPLLKFCFSTWSKDYEKIDFSKWQKKYHYVFSGFCYHEYVNKKTDKSRGVEQLRKHLKITKENVYCFGDEMNDYLMIKNFNGVAMENSCEEVKKVAKFITKSVAEDGVSYFIENKILKGKISVL